MSIFALICALILGVVGQYFLKIASTSININDLYSVLLNVNLIIGLGFYGISTIFYLVALRAIPLSIAYPVLSLGYVFILLIGRFLLNENISNYQYFGVLLILAGVCFVALK